MVTLRTVRGAVVVPLVVAVLTGLVGPGSWGTGTHGTTADSPSTQAGAKRGTDAVSRRVAFEVSDTNTTSVPCAADNRAYTLHGRLVGPRGTLGKASIHRVNVLVHDSTSGSWFWHLRSHPAFDYASRLAERGETSLVLDRLGYDHSPIGDGRATCLGAQASMLHTVVQHLYAGKFTFPGSDRPLAAPAAEHVVLHGHGVGAAIAQVEAGTFDDVDGLVLMSWTDSGASRLAVDEAARQSGRCLRGAEYSFFGRTAADFRRLLFASTTTGVRRTASALRNATPCGDALSLAPLLAAQASTTRKIEVPVLLLFGSKDVLIRPDAARAQRQAYGPAVEVTSHTVRGAGSALPLERSAGETRRHVLRWLHALR